MYKTDNLILAKSEWLSPVGTPSRIRPRQQRKKISVRKRARIWLLARGIKNPTISEIESAKMILGLNGYQRTWKERQVPRGLGFVSSVVPIREKPKRRLVRISGLRRRLIERDGLICCWCEKECEPNVSPNADMFPTIEHVIPKSEGGTNDMSNLKVACRKCNNGRHAKEN